MPSRISRRAVLAAGLCALSPAAAAPRDRSVADLAKAYPECVAAVEGNRVRMKNGTVFDAGPLDPNKPFKDRLLHATLSDMFRQPYPTGPAAAPGENVDPGRFRNKAFFDAMYGDCRSGGTEARTAHIVWLPRSWGKKLTVTRVNGVDRKLAAVSEAIEALPEAVRRAAYPSAGTFACRTVADNAQPSMHAYAAAIDLNLDFSDYWMWQAEGGRPRWRNRMPQAIVDIFERYGFIWGGRWYHYDTMHFEYRPELLP